MQMDIAVGIRCNPSLARRNFASLTVASEPAYLGRDRNSMLLAPIFLPFQQVPVSGQQIPALRST
jgi:hypothetical protein